MKTRIVLRNRVADNSHVIALDGKRLNDDNSCHRDTIHVFRVNNKMHRVIIIRDNSLFINFQLVSEETYFRCSFGITTTTIIAFLHDTIRINCIYMYYVFLYFPNNRNNTHERKRRKIKDIST